MFGKHFESMYEGSMYGAGIPVFAVWGYVIAHVRKSRVELNSKKLSDTLGGSESEIDQAIAFLMRPDPKSRHKEHGGRRLIKEGEFQYFVPSWEKYQGLRNADDRREYNRLKQREYRAKKKGNPLPGEKAYVKALENEGQEAADKVLEQQQQASLPDSVSGVKTDDEASKQGVGSAPEKPVSDAVNEDERPGHFEAGKWVLD